MSFLNNLIKKPVGVTIRKNIIPITIGEIILPKNIPNLNHIIFKGVNILESLVRMPTLLDSCVIKPTNLSSPVRLFP